MLKALAPIDPDEVLPEAELLRHIRLTEGDTWNGDIARDLRVNAIDWVEGYSEHSLQLRDFEWTRQHFTPVMRFPIRPVEDVVSIAYFDSAGVDSTVADWQLGDNQLAPAHNAFWPYVSGAPGGVRIVFSAGYETQADIPSMLTAAVKVATAAMFLNAESPDLSPAQRLIDRFRNVL